jgi:hypothetical protein
MDEVRNLDGRLQDERAVAGAFHGPHSHEDERTCCEGDARLHGVSLSH